MQYIKSCKVDSVWLENLSTPDMFQIQTWDDQGIHFLCKWRKVNFLLPGAKVNGELPCPCMSHTHRLPLLELSTNLFIAKSNKGWQMIHAVKEHMDFRAAIATLANPWWRRKMTTTKSHVFEDFKLEVTKCKITKIQIMFGNLLEFLEKVSIITSVFLAIKKWLPGLFPGLGVRELDC